MLLFRNIPAVSSANLKTTHTQLLAPFSALRVQQAMCIPLAVVPCIVADNNPLPFELVLTELLQDIAGEALWSTKTSPLEPHAAVSRVSLTCVV